VAVPAVQFPTLYAAVRWCGHAPVLVDVDDSLNMDPSALRETAAEDVLDAVAFVHMAGNPVNIQAVRDVCAARGWPLIEDACEALGAVSDGVKAGNWGRVSATSTHAAHHISTGEGGLVFTDSDACYRKMRRLRDWGRSQGHRDLDGYYPGYSFSEAGLNLHATDIQAAIGLVQLGRLDGFIFARRMNWAKLRLATRDLPFQVPRVDDGDEPSWYTFPLLTTHRDKLAEHLGSAGIETRPIVAGNMARQPVVADALPGRFPVADRVFREGLWMSVHPALTQDDLALIARTLRSFPWE
jgi:dTDP-4-amino-4,6-dideoxygalactose transaminase